MRNKAGYILIESIIAITIVMVGLLGIFSLLSRSLSLNRVVADRFIASYLAAEGIEIVKNIIDNNLIAGRPWNRGLDDGNYELDYSSLSLGTNQDRFLAFDAGTGTYGYRETTATPYKRRIAVANSAGGESIRVNSVVTWTTRGGGRFTINLEDHFFNWR